MFEAVNRIYRNWGIGVFVLPVLVVVALFGLTVTHSDRTAWVSGALRAEFTSVDYGPEAMPKQLAQRAGEIRPSQLTDLKHNASQR
jgi:hypothetical protein